MRIQESAEDYLESILILQQKKGQVRSIDVAGELCVSKPSVSIAMRQLRENGYVVMDEGGLLSLTDKGRQIAERVYERHQLLTNWLVALGVDAETAATDACRIEHVISAESFEKIKQHVASCGL